MRKVIIFDYDDTLVDTLGSRIPAIKEYVRKVEGIDILDADIMRVWGTTFATMMEKLGCKKPVDMALYLSIASAHPIVPFPETFEVLSTLARRNILGIVTSLAREILNGDMAYLSWNTNWFSAIVTQEDTLYHKPDPRVFEPVRRILEKLGEGPPTLYIGNSLSDATAALQAGIEFLGIARSREQQEEFSSKGITWRDSLLEVQRIISPRAMSP